MTKEKDEKPKLSCIHQSDECLICMVGRIKLENQSQAQRIADLEKALGEAERALRFLVKPCNVECKKWHKGSHFWTAASKGSTALESIKNVKGGK